MRFKHILPTAVILLLAGTFATAQVITRALQLSQDTTGAFSVDANLGAYFPGHIYSSAGGNTSSRPAPTINGGAGATPTVVGTDTSGLITFGTSAVTATLTFGTPYVTVPWCVVTWQAPGTVSPVSYTVLTGSIALVQNPPTSANKVNYWCSSAS